MGVWNQVEQCLIVDWRHIVAMLHLYYKNRSESFSEIYLSYIF